MVRLDGCAELGGVVGGEELSQGIGDEGGIAQAVVAVDIGPAHRLHQIVGAGGRVIALASSEKPEAMLRISQIVAPPELGGGAETMS